MPLLSAVVQSSSPWWFEHSGMAWCFYTCPTSVGHPDWAWKALGVDLPGSGVKFSHIRILLVVETLPGNGHCMMMTTLPTPTMKENQLFPKKKKKHLLGLCFTLTRSNAVHAQFHWLANVYSKFHAAAGHVTSFAWSWNTLNSVRSRSTASDLHPVDLHDCIVEDRWHDRTTPRSTRSIDREVKHETLPINRECLIALHCTRRRENNGQCTRARDFVNRARSRKKDAMATRSTF